MYKCFGMHIKIIWNNKTVGWAMKMNIERINSGDTLKRNIEKREKKSFEKLSRE